MNKTINKQNNTTTACRLTKINTNFCLAALLIRTSCCYPENQVKSTICGKVNFTHEYGCNRIEVTIIIYPPAYSFGL